MRIFIPGDFKIEDYARVASTCTVISGFSDEISCEIEGFAGGAGPSGPRGDGHYLVAKGGFDSEQYVGDEFSFYISEIKNPFTTQPSGKFDMEIYDKYGGLQYYYPDEFTMKVTASQFSFAFVESQSPVNGVSSLLEVTLTLGVDTPNEAYLAIGLPAELEFDDTVDFTCEGKMNAAGSISCDKRDGRMPFI